MRSRTNEGNIRNVQIHVDLALLFGFFSLMYGVSQITTGIQLRNSGRTLHSVLEDAA